MNETQPPAKAGIVSSVRVWALRLGLAGFLGGFFGPMILRPDANQGPMLGIFITGPLGVLVGALFGMIQGIRQK